MRILLTGATGYLGSAVLAALLADGHAVHALVRSPEAGARVSGAEPVVGDLGDAGWLRDQVAAVEGVVHTASPNDATSGAFDAAFLDAVLPVLSGTGAPLIYTGGTWIHGSGPAITEDTPPDPPAIVAWRPAALRRVREAAGSGIRAVVIGPANLYGDGGGIPALIARAPTSADGLLVVGGDQHFANVHRHDVAALYSLAVTEAPPGAYYLAANDRAPTMREVAAAASTARGLGGRIAPEPATDSRERLGPLYAPLVLDQQVDAGRARALGWRPVGSSLLDELASGAYGHPDA